MQNSILRTKNSTETKSAIETSLVQMPTSLLERIILAGKRNDSVYYAKDETTTLRGVPIESAKFYFSPGTYNDLVFIIDGEQYIRIATIIDNNDAACHSAVESNDCGCSICRN